MKDSLTGCEDFIAHCFENHGVEEKSDAKMIKNLITFVSLILMRFVLIFYINTFQK